MRAVFAVLITLSLLLTACGLPADPPPSALSVYPTTTWVTGWNIHHDLGLLAIVDGNQAEAAVMMRAQWSATAQNGQLTLSMGCCDGRQNRAFALGAQTPELADFTFVDSGTLAASLGNEPWNVDALRFWTVETHQVYAIDIATHGGDTCTGCGAQGLLADLIADPAKVSALESKGLGLTARYVQSTLYSPNPGVQAVWEGWQTWQTTGGTVEVDVWYFNHVRQQYQPLAVFVPGQQPISVIPLDQLTPTYPWSGEILTAEQLSQRAAAVYADSLANSGAAVAKMAEAGLNPALGQSFANIVFSGTGMPDELILGTDVFGPDLVFNAKVPVAPDATISEFSDALDASFAAGDYAIAHAGENTRVIGIFRSREQAEIWLARLQQEQVAKGFLADAKKAQVYAFVVDDSGRIVDTMIVKPAAQSVVTLITGEFRGMPIDSISPDGWFTVKGDGDPRFNQVEFKPYGESFAWRKKPRLDTPTPLDTQILGLKAQAEYYGFDPESFYWQTEKGQSVIYMMDDLGEPMPYRALRLNQWGELDSIAFSVEDMLVWVAENKGVYMVDDLQLLNLNVRWSGRQGQLVGTIADWEYAAVGEVAKAKFPTIESYRAWIRARLSRSYKIRLEAMHLEDPVLASTAPRTINWQNKPMPVVDPSAPNMAVEQIVVPASEAELTATLERAAIKVEPGRLAKLWETVSPFVGKTLRIVGYGLEITWYIVIIEETGEVLFQWGPDIQVPTGIYWPVDPNLDPDLYSVLRVPYTTPSSELAWKIPAPISTGALFDSTAPDRLPNLYRIWDQAQIEFGLGAVGSVCGGFSLDDYSVVFIPGVTDIVEFDIPAGVGYCATGSVNQPEKIYLYDSGGDQIVFRFDTTLDMPDWVLESGDMNSLDWRIRWDTGEGISCYEQITFVPAYHYAMEFRPFCTRLHTQP